MWDRLRSFKSRSSSQSSGERSRSCSPAGTENQRRKRSGVIHVLHNITRRPLQPTASGDDGSLVATSSHTPQRSQDRRADPLGLTALYTPKNPPSTDIIFIHGLGGTSHQTWSKNKDSALFWPQKWLPEEPEVCTARIFSFGYNAHFASLGSNSVSNISDFAKSLLFAMKFGKDENAVDLGIGDRPIIFIAHSMGGLVFKKAYIQGHSNNEYQSIVDKVIGVLFLATPHRGTHLAGTLNRILAVSIFNHTPKQYITDLNRNSSALEDMNETFRNFAVKLRIFSLYETLYTLVGPKSIMVLDKDSSILGYPGEVSHPLDANHHDVCKYTNPQDPNYVSVRSILITLISNHHESQRKIQKAKYEATRQSIERLLDISNTPSSDYELLRGRWTPGTCESVLSDKCFQEWTKNAQVSNILWINGHPGSGKSVLASFVIKHLLDSARKCEYFFFKHDDSTKRCASSLIRSLALQIAYDIPAFGDAIHKMNESGLRLEKHDAKSIWQKLFVSTLFNLEHGPICWVIDALDESDSIHAVIEMLSNLSSSKTPIHVIILSRQTLGISMALDRISSMLPLTTMSLDYNTDDIRLHAMSELAYMHGTAELRQKIVEKIVKRSQGSFLWANLVLQDIVECHSYNEIKIAIEEIPSGMDSLYQRMEAAIKELPKESEKSLARAILHWATYSRRPLKIDEFAAALRPEFSEILDLKFTIKKTCGHFAIVDRNDCVSLVHQTARDFLIKESSLPFSLSPQEAHNDLCKRTLSMYLDGQVRSQLAKTPLPHFYSYSATSWGHHLNLSSTASDDIFNMLLNFFQGSYVLSWIQALAVLGQLKVLISTSQILTSFIHRRRKIDATKMPLLHRLSDLQLLEVWAVDLLKIVGKFGSHLLQEPEIIYKYIAQFSPSNSAIFQQFNKSTQTSISVSGLSDADWDDCLARVSVGSDHLALQLTSSARNLAVLSSAGTIHLWNSLTFEKLADIFQREHIFSMCFSKDGDKLATYGSLSTCVWAIPMGHQLVKVANPPNSRALCMVFADKDSTLIMGSSLRDIRKLHLNKPECGWLSTKISTSSKETTPKGAFSNAPTAMAFDHGMDKVAIAYRGSPMTVWALEEPKCISIYKRSLANGRNESTKWMGVNRVVWHPFSGEILGIHTDGVVFKWHPLEEKRQELQTDLSLTPSEIQCSQDGLVFATSDVNGTIRLYNHEHFAILYQLSSEDVITALCFSADTRRLFDLRGSYCNVWEPNALIRMPNIDEDAEIEEGSTTISRQVSEAWTESRSSITALAARSQGLVFCTGNDDGVVQLCSTNDNKRQIVGRSATGMGIDHLVWAEDGATLAYAEPGGYLVIQSIIESDGRFGGLEWKCEPLVRFKTNVKTGGITQILIGPNSGSLLLASLNSAQLWCLKTQKVQAVYNWSTPGSIHRWISHPRNQDQLLAFSPSAVTLCDWGTLDKLGEWQFSTEGFEHSQEYHLSRMPNSTVAENITSPIEAEHRIETVSAVKSSDYVLVHSYHPSSSPQRESLVQIIELSALNDSFSHGGQSLPTSVLPEAITANIEKVLGVLGTDLVVFLDQSFWVCTYPIDSEQRRGFEQPKRHFFLPRDWVNAESLELCQVMADGTVLCPRKGEIAVIKSTLEEEV